MIMGCSLSLLLFISLYKICNSTVIIIGAGAAGIATATKLLENNITDILIMEAEKRVGGRINSIELGNAFVDMGAEWCHGQEGNVVYDLVKPYAILGHTEISYNIFYSDGQQVDESFSQQLFNIVGKIYSPDGNKNQTEGLSLGEYCVNKYVSALNEFNITTAKRLKIANNFLDFFQHWVLSSEGAFSWFEPSAQSDYRDCPGDLAQNWNGRGFKTILEIMMHKFPKTSTSLSLDDKIILGKKVERIVWDTKDNDIIVKCSDGSWYQGDQVVFTASLGVLKENQQSLFEPQLPLQKQIAIEKLGIGAVLKSMFLYQRSWWPQEFTGANLLWTTEHKNTDFHKFTKIGRIWILDAFALVPVANNPNVLCIWFSGKSVPIIEQLDKIEFLEGVHFIFRTFFEASYNLTYPISFTRSRWYTNPHFRGTYSYQTTASRQINSNGELAKPLFNRNDKLTLMFAGEATHSHFYSTVHGAIETGYREAERIIRILNKT